MRNILMSIMGFIVVSFLALAATDYFQQSVVAGKDAGEFTLSDWADSFAQRGREAAARAERELRRDKPMRDYLPDAPSGWTEVAWAPEYQAVMKGESAPRPEAWLEIEAEMDRHPVMWLDKAIGTVKGRAAEAKKRKSRRVFVRDDQVIILNAKFIDTRQNRGMFAMFTGSADAVHNKRPIEVVHRGVAFRDITPKKAPEGVLRLRGEIHGQLEIIIDANATKSDVSRLIARTDVASLRALTDPPSVRGPSHAELVAEMRLEKSETRYQTLERQARIDRKLKRMMRSAKARGQNEVCITERGQQHCRWVE